MHAVAIEGTFDDCQALLKAMFNHHAFRDRVRLSGVNSINWARVVAQAVYYFTAAVALGAPQRKVAFTVPTGNFGDVYAGYVAARMGLPIDRLVIATNVNDILARTFTTGAYDAARGDRHRLALDGHPGLVQFRASAVRGLWPRRQAGGGADGLAGAVAALRAFRARARANCARCSPAGRADEEECAATMRAWMREAGYCADPHTAIGLAVAEKEARDPAVPMVVLSTAHPAKFPDAVEAACGSEPALPDWLGDLGARAERVTVLPAEQAAVERFVASVSRAAQEGAAA